MVAGGAGGRGWRHGWRAVLHIAALQGDASCALSALGHRWRRGGDINARRHGFPYAFAAVQAFGFRAPHTHAQSLAAKKKGPLFASTLVSTVQ